MKKSETKKDRTLTRMKRMGRKGREEVHRKHGEKRSCVCIWAR